MARQFVLAIAVVAVAGLPAGAADRSPEPLKLQVSPLVLFAEGDVLVQLRVEPDQRSRVMAIEWWSIEGGGGLHQVNLDGERAAIRHSFVIKRIEGGDYTIAVALTRSDGTRVVRSITLRVLARGVAPQ